MLMYEYLGLQPEIIKAWQQVHGSWRFKSNNIKGTHNSMRTTG